MKTTVRTICLSALLAAAFFLVPHHVSAKECTEYSGACKSSCDTDEFDAESLYQNWNSVSLVGLTEKALDLKPGEVINCGAQRCCIPKGEEACQHIGYAYKTPAAGMAWGCTALGCTDALNPTPSNKDREYCPGEKICCRYKVRVGTTESMTVIVGSSKELSNPLGQGATFFSVINRVIRVFLGMVGALAFAVFFYAGVTWMTAGSSERVQTAKDAMKYAVIGLLLIGFSFAITNFIIDALANRGSVASPASQQPAQEAVPLGE